MKIEKSIAEIFAKLRAAHAETMIRLFEAKRQREQAPVEPVNYNAAALRWIIAKRLAGY